MSQPFTGVEVLSYRPGTNLTKEMYANATSWAVDASGSLTIQQPAQGSNVTAIALYPPNNWFRVRLISSTLAEVSSILGSS